MKTTIKIIALLAAAGYPCVAFANFFGASLPASLNLETFGAVFVVALASLTFISDYSRRYENRLNRTACRRPANANCGHGKAANTHRLAA